jgi:hypothetical protein
VAPNICCDVVALCAENLVALLLRLSWLLMFDVHAMRCDANNAEEN